MSLEAGVDVLMPPSLRPGETLVVASHNEGKVAELREMLAPYGLVIQSAAELDLPEPDEVGGTFEENAGIKAFCAAIASGLPALADDSGLAVDALGGKPGVQSARWSGPNRDFDHAMRLVEEQLRSTGANTPEQRRARFIAVLCLAWPDGQRRSWHGAVEGRLVWPPRGDQGFGYDPIFLPDGESRTFGEMTREEKHGLDRGLSHRARAFAAFAEDMLKGDGDGR